MAVAVRSPEEGVAGSSPVMAAEGPRCQPTMSWPRWQRNARPAGGRSARRLQVVGPNAVRSHRAHALSVLDSQLRSPLLMLLAVTVMAVVDQIEITG
jgi:hypothetical protein